MSESIGGYLARQRKLRGISLDELATVTRIPRRSLERLERGAFDGERDGFARGFVRTVAGALGLPADDTVNRMLPEPEAGVDAEAGGGWGRLVLALLLGALALSLPLFWINRIAPPTSSDPVSEVVVRRDAVKILAESVGALAPTAEPQAAEPGE